jgi:hypothetical protein
VIDIEGLIEYNSCLLNHLSSHLNLPDLTYMLSEGSDSIDPTNNNNPLADGNGNDSAGPSNFSGTNNGDTPTDGNDNNDNQEDNNDSDTDSNSSAVFSDNENRSVTDGSSESGNENDDHIDNPPDFLPPLLHNFYTLLLNEVPELDPAVRAENEESFTESDTESESDSDSDSNQDSNS